MKKIIFAAGILASALTGIGTGSVAQAAPISVERPFSVPTGTASGPSVQGPASGDVVKIDYACGRGWHLSRHGVCRPNRPPPPPPRWHRPPPRWDDRPHHWHGHDRPPPPPPGWYRY
jgi:hypothetical protein